MTQLDLGRIRAFVAAADARNLSRAAALVHLTQPALSKQISALEDDLGVRLFDRVSSGVQLTSAGHDLLERARHLLLQAEDLRQRACLLQAGATGVLNVGATSMSIESFVAPFIFSFREQWPQVDVRVTEGGGMHLLRQVERGDLHLAITGPRAPHLVFQLLFPVRMVAVMAADHRFAQCRTIELRKIVDEPLLALSPEFTGRQLFDAACQMSGLRQRVAFESGVPHALLAMARIRCGVAIVPSNQLIEGPTFSNARHRRSLGARQVAGGDAPPHYRQSLRDGGGSCGGDAGSSGRTRNFLRLIAKEALNKSMAPATGLFRDEMLGARAGQA